MATIAVALAGGATAWFLVPPVAPSPPELSKFDPLVAQAIRRSLWEARVFRFDVDRWLKLGMIYEANDVSDLAAQCYEYVVSRRPDDARYWYRLACATERTGDATTALGHLDRAIALVPKFSPIHWRRGWWLLELGDRQAARGEFEMALKLDAAAAGACAGMAMCLLQEGNSTEAIEILEQLARRSNDPHVHRLLGSAYLQAGRRDEATVQMHLAGEARAHWPDRWSDDMFAYTTGIAFITLTASELAATDASAVVRLLEPLPATYPDNETLQCSLGKAYGQLGRVDQAMASFERALAIQPRSSIACSGVSATWQARRDFEKAMQWIDRAIELNPRMGILHQQRGRVLLDMLREREAIAEFERAFELEPGNVAALVLKGRTQLRIGDWNGAEQSFRRALAGNPTLASAHVGLGWTQIELGRLAEADQSLRTAASFNDSEEGLQEARLLLERRQAASRGSPTP